MNNIELIFVYNAESGFFNGIKDLIHKSVSPKTYSCNLCSLTYKGTVMKQEWKEFVESLPIQTAFLHKDEFAKQYPRYALTTYPIVFKKEDGVLKEFISTDEINKQNNLEELRKLVEDKLDATA